MHRSSLDVQCALWLMIASMQLEPDRSIKFVSLRKFTLPKSELGILVCYIAT